MMMIMMMMMMVVVVVVRGPQTTYIRFCNDTESDKTFIYLLQILNTFGHCEYNTRITNCITTKIYHNVIIQCNRIC